MPKGLVHTTAGYLLYSSFTHKQIFNYKKGEVFLNDENYRKAAEWFEKANGVNSRSTVEALYQLGSA